MDTTAPDAEEAASGFRKPKAGPHVHTVLCPTEEALEKWETIARRSLHVLVLAMSNLKTALELTPCENAEKLVKQLEDEIATLNGLIQ